MVLLQRGDDMTEKEFNEELIKRKLNCQFERIDMTKNFKVIVWKNEAMIMEKYISFESAEDDFSISLTLNGLLKEIDIIINH